MSKEKQENDHPAALGMIEKLSQRYPKTFTHEPHGVRPLARGIREAIIADAPDLPASIVSQALAIYAAWLPYMRACIAGAPRIDLSGDPAGVVTEKEAMYAVQRLAARERKRDEGRAEREAAVRKAQEAGERPRQAAERRARSVKGEAVTVKQVIIAAKAETAAVERVAGKLLRRHARRKRAKIFRRALPSADASRHRRPRIWIVEDQLHQRRKAQPQAVAVGRWKLAP